jgi:arylsulfatase A-like enzyme
MRASAAWLWLTLAAASAGAADRPSFLVIIADDLGKEWVSCYGSEHQTPNIDRLAAEGMRFTNAYVTPLCTPTRHELLTGRYPFRTGWNIHYDVPRWGGIYFDWTREVTFLRMLKSAGYATAIAGKWQLNDLRHEPDAFKQHGFDEYCVWPGAESDNPPAMNRYFDPFVQENGRRETRTGAFGPDIFSDYIIDFMKRHRDQPFCAYYPMVLPHTPLTATPLNRDKDLKGTALFAGMVDYVDLLVGQAVKTLDDLRIRDRTCIIFVGDNGTVSGLPCRADGRKVNGGKGTLAETGICTPFVISRPGRIPAGKVSDELIDCTDIMPTLSDLSGAALPKDVVIDGKSFAEVLQGKPQASPRRDWIYSQLGNKRVIRDKRFKLWSDDRFFDLAADPSESSNLADSSDPQVVAARNKLIKVLKSLPPDARLPFPPPPSGKPGGE